MPQDFQSSSEHDLILKNVESLRAAVVDKQTNGVVNTIVTDQATVPVLRGNLQKWEELECKNIELQCHIDFFEKAYETQQKSAFASTTNEIEKLLEANKKLESVFTSHKDQLLHLHSLGDELANEDVAKVKKVLEATDQRWNHILCSLKGQARFLETKLNAFYSFESNVKDFMIWLGKLEAMLLFLDKTSSTSTPSSGGTAGVLEFKKSARELSSEMEAYKKILESLNTTGNDMAIGLQKEARELLQIRLDDINKRWNQMRTKCDAIQSNEEKERHEKQLKAFNLLLQKLIELDVWLKCLEDKLSSQMSSPGGDALALHAQVKCCEDLQHQLEEKSPQVENYLRLGKQSIEMASEDSESHLDDLRLLSETVKDHLNAMETKWLDLRQKIQEHQLNIEDAIKIIGRLDDILTETKQLLDILESSKSKWQPVDEIPPGDLQSAVNQTRLFEAHLMPIKVKVGECAIAVQHLKDGSVMPSLKVLNQQEDINERLRIFEASIEDRLNLLMLAALKKIDPAMQHQLSVTITYPWKRAITEGKQVPYFINHETESTQWNHPEMTNIFLALADLNSIKFSAYRTAMKLRLLQKRLSLEKLNATKLLELYKRNDLMGPHNHPMTVDDIIKCLTMAFEEVKTSNDAKFNAVLSIDLVLNWLLNVYDRSRSGQLWRMSFKVALLLLSSGNLEEKYRAIFGMIADESTKVDEFGLSLLLQDCVLIPKQLGEATAFGGTSVDGAVRSCFEKAGNCSGIDVTQFIDWMNLEPQSLVWIPVLHRMADAEGTVHQIRCSSCKISPITGLRYRCLKCFGVDLCQNCFFLGQSVKGHEVTHPMQEYAGTASSGEELRNISKILKNKLRSPQYYKKHPRLGYLPVETTPDAVSLSESQAESSLMASNGSTQDMHSRLELYANKLAEVEKRTPSATSECEDEHELIGQFCRSLGGGTSRSFQLQSPMQIMLALDADQKSELETIVKDLEEENRVLQTEYDLLRQDSSSMTSKANDDDAVPDNKSQSRDVEMIAEAKLLRLYKERLESRMEILEDHNSRLNSQLQRLKQLLSEQTVSSGHSIIYPSRQMMTTPSMSAASSQNSLTRSGPPSFSPLAFRGSRPSLMSDKGQSREEPNYSSLGRRRRVGPVRSRGSSLSSPSSMDDVAFEASSVNKELDRLIDGITSYVDASTKEDVV